MCTTPPEDQRICAWFDSQSEEFITDLMEKHGYDLTPRKAWEAFSGSPAAQESQSESVPAPAEAVQQVATQAQLAASHTALRLVRMALLISTTPQEQNACLVAFVSQANRVMELSGLEASQ